MREYPLRRDQLSEGCHLPSKHFFVNFRSSITVFPGKRHHFMLIFDQVNQVYFLGKRDHPSDFEDWIGGRCRVSHPGSWIQERAFAKVFLHNKIATGHPWWLEFLGKRNGDTKHSQPWIPSSKCMHNTPNLRSTKILKMRMMMKLAWFLFFSGVSVCMSSLPYLPPINN